MQKTPIWQFKAYQNWVKTILIGELVENGDYVAELYCGTGLDTGKWERAKIGRYMGLDPVLENLTEAESKWQQKKCPYQAEFKEIDLINESLVEKLKIHNNSMVEDDKLYDIVSSFDGIQTAFDTLQHAEQLIRNVSAKLKYGGYFFGMIPDSSAIWYKSQKVTSGLPCIKSTLFNIDFDSDVFTFYGSKYNLSLKDGSNITENLIHFPTFINLCKKYNLLFIEASNLMEFYEDNKKNYESKLKQSGVLGSKGKIEPAQMELISLYTTFIFHKELEHPQIIQN